MKQKSEIRLLFQGHLVATATADRYFGKNDFKNVHGDATYLSNPQFQLFLARDGRWNIKHVPGANNETIVDGRSLKNEIVITNGMTVSVGNIASGVQKFPLILEVDATGISSNSINLVGFKSSAGSVIKSIDEAISKLAKTINWPKIGSGVSALLSGTASILGIFFGAIFRGLLNGGSGSFGSGEARIHRGNSLYNEVILTINGNEVHEGNSMFNTVLMTINGNQIHRGNSIFGEVIACVNGQTVHEGNSIFGKVIATINGDSVHDGYSMFGTIIAKVEGGGRMAGAAAAAYLLIM